MIHAQCCNKTEPSECWINIHYLDWLRLFRFITVRQRLVSRGSKNPACWNPTFSIVWLFERKDGWGVRLPLRYYIFFFSPFSLATNIKPRCIHFCASMDLGETGQSLGPQNPKLIARTRWKLLAKVCALYFNSICIV